jgi:hypothetical protein
VPAITISGAFSASSWFKCSSYHLDIPVDFAGHGIAVGGLSGAGAGTGPYSGVISPDSNYSYHYSGSAPTLSAGTYYSLIATYDGSSTWTWYVNGSAYSCGSSNTYNSSLNANRIGWSNGGSACSLWDAMLWNRVLTAPEIAAVSSQSNSVLYTVGGSNLILPPATFNPSWAAANRQIGVR